MNKSLLLAVVFTSLVAIADEGKKEKGADYSKITNYLINTVLKKDSDKEKSNLQNFVKCEYETETLDGKELILIFYNFFGVASILRELSETDFKNIDRIDLNKEIIVQLNECPGKNWCGFKNQIELAKFYQLDAGTKCKLQEKKNESGVPFDAKCLCETVVPKEYYEKLKTTFQEKQAQKMQQKEQQN